MAQLSSPSLVERPCKLRTISITSKKSGNSVNKHPHDFVKYRQQIQEKSFVMYEVRRELPRWVRWSDGRQTCQNLNVLIFRKSRKKSIHLILIVTSMYSGSSSIPQLGSCQFWQQDICSSTHPLAWFQLLNFLITFVSRKSLHFSHKKHSF